jgi:hypothetical protein
MGELHTCGVIDQDDDRVPTSLDCLLDEGWLIEEKEEQEENCGA